MNWLFKKYSFANAVLAFNYIQECCDGWVMPVFRLKNFNVAIVWMKDKKEK